MTVKQWCIEVTEIHSLLIENNLQWACEVNLWIYFVTNGFQVRQCLLVARAGIWLDMTHRDTVVRASLVAKFSVEQNFNEAISMKNSAFFFLFTSVFHPFTEDSFFDLIWTKGKGRKGSMLKGIWESQKKDGRDGVTAHHPCHLDKLSSVLLVLCPLFPLFFF